MKFGINLWTIKCLIGKEKETASILMRKFLHLQYSDTVSGNYG